MEAITFPYLNRVAERSRENAIPWWFGSSLSDLYRDLIIGKITETIDKSRYGLPSIPVEPKWAAAANCKRLLDNDTMLIKEYAEYGYVVRGRT